MELELPTTSGETWNGLPVIRQPHGRWETNGLSTTGWCVEASTHVLECDAEVDIECDAKCETKLFEPKQIVTCREVCLPYTDADALRYHDDAIGCAIGECIVETITNDPDYELLLADAVDPVAAVTALETADAGLSILGSSALVNYAAGLFCCPDISQTIGGTPVSSFPDFPITGDGETLLFAVRNPTLVLGPVEPIEGPEYRRNRLCLMTVQSVALVYEPCGGPFGVTMKFCGACC